MRTTYAFLLAAVLTGLGGCVSAPPPAGVTIIDAQRVSQLLEVGTPQLSATETGTLRALVSVRSLAKGRMMVEGRARFLGENGQTLEAPTSWQAVFIEGESSGTLQFLSMSAAARQVTVEIREGNR